MELIFTLTEIKTAATRLLNLMGDNKIVAMHGEMGAGKTTFIHALCDVLGVEDVVTSPTFSIINQYFYNGNETIYHIDLYRLKNNQEAIATGVEDCFYSGSYCFVEWPEKAPAIFPHNTIHAWLYTVDINTRKLLINL